MKKLLLIFVMSITWTLNAQTIPEHKSNSYVNDFANVINDEDEKVLDAKIRNFMEKSTIEMTVVSINSLDGSDVDTYSNKLFRQWGIGKKELNNGLLVLFSVADHKWRIEVGAGLEEYLADGYTRVKAKELMVPNFKAGNYYAGVNALLGDFINTLGPISWDQRKALEKKAAEAEAIRAQESTDAVLNFFMWFAILLGVGLVIGYFIRKEYLRKKAIADAIEAQARLIASLKNKISDAIINFNRMTRWLGENSQYFPNNLNMEFNNRSSSLEAVLFNIKNSTRKDEEAFLNEQYSYAKGKIDEYVTPQFLEMYNKVSEFKKLKDNIMNADKTVLLNANIFSTKERFSRLYSQFGAGVVDMAFPEAMFRDKSKTVLDVWAVLKEQRTADDISKFEKMKSSYNEMISIANSVDNHLKVINSKLESIETSSKFVNANRDKIPSLLNDANRAVNRTHVTSSTKTRFNTVKTKAGMFTLNDNPLIAYSALNSLITEIKDVITRANRDISDEEDRIAEEERRRRRRREEEAAALAAAMYSSSSSSYSSSSSSDYGSSSSSSSSDFGGGSSNGGGSSGDW